MKASDQVCVAALNSCLDLEKFRLLDATIMGRLAVLLRHHRIGMVCFMPDVGFGLRVYEDPKPENITGDEATLFPDRATVDESGVWVRCPASMFSPANLPTFLIMNERGTGCFRRWERKSPSDDDEEEDGWVESEPTPATHAPVWTSARGSARRFTKADAEKYAAFFGGIVVKE